MLEIICCNDKFSSELLILYSKYNVITPKKGNFYTIREIVNFVKGEKGLLLNEIVNDPIPTINSLGFKANMETAWAISRFTTLNNETLTNEMVTELKRDEKHEKVTIKTEENGNKRLN